MRLSLSSGGAQAAAAPPRHSWLSLPGLCCQAAGGDPREADRVAAAWVLVYTAAHLFDSVEDGDPAESWWQDLGQGPAINVATGLLTSAWLVLAQLGIQRSTVQQLIEDFQHTGLQVVSGQHLDLTDPRPSLRSAWAIAEAKSGAFFGLACRSGARLAGAPQPAIDQYYEFGFNLGLIVQIGDDLEDVRAGRCEPPLAVAYWTEMGLEAEYGRIAALTTGCSTDSQIRPISVEALADGGAELYLLTKLAQFRARALNSLDAAGAAQPAKDQLADIICSLVPQLEAIPQYG